MSEAEFWSPGEHPGARFLRRADAGRKDLVRSRITDGSVFLPHVPARNPWVRRCKRIIRAHLIDLGGEDNASAAERSIIRRVGALSVELEHLEAKFALDDKASAQDLDLYQRTANSLRRLLEAVGLQRRPRDVTPDPLSYAHEISTDEDAA